MPMISGVVNLTDPEEEPCEFDVEETGFDVDEAVEILTIPSLPVVVAGTFAGADTEVYPFSTQYCA